jgi:hypothetical protein
MRENSILAVIARRVGDAATSKCLIMNEIASLRSQ